MVHIIQPTEVGGAGHLLPDLRLHLTRSWSFSLHSREDLVLLAIKASVMIQKVSVSVLPPSGLTAQPLVEEEMKPKLLAPEGSAESSVISNTK